DGRGDRLDIELRRRPRLDPGLLELLRVPGGVASPLECPDADGVGADVVGVPVAAELVVGRDDVRLVAPHQPGEPACSLIDVRLPERARVAVAARAPHPRVTVDEAPPLSHDTV